MASRKNMPGSKLFPRQNRSAKKIPAIARERFRVAKRLWIARSQDRARSYLGSGRRDGRIPGQWRNNAGLMEYNSWLCGRGNPKLEAIVDQKFAGLRAGGEKRKVDVLDAGCGLGQALADLKECAFLQGKVRVAGLTLARPLDKKALEKEYSKARVRLLEEGKRHELERLEYGYEKAVKELGQWQKNSRLIDEVHVGLAETHKFGKKFDLIVSTGMLEAAVNPFKAVSNLLSHLQANGMAVLQLGAPLTERELALLKRKGFGLKQSSGLVYWFERKK